MLKLEKGQEIQFWQTSRKTMFDQHIVEKSFNELLESYRSEVLPSIVEGWNDLLHDELMHGCMDGVSTSRSSTIAQCMGVLLEL